MAKAKKKPVKKKSVVKNPVYNVHHPDFNGKFEVAFVCGKRKFYRCIKDFYYPVGRYQFIEQRLAEADLRITTKLLKDYIKELMKHLEGKNGTINLVRVTELVINLSTHVNLEFSPMTIKRLAAVAYVDESEDVREFDQDYGDRKIQFWEVHGDFSFFLTRPIGELLNANDTSGEYLLKYMKTMTEEERNLISELYSPSSEKI